MLSTTLREAADQFGQVLSRAPILATLRAATDALEGDPVARDLLANLNERRGELVRLQQAGLTPSQLQINSFRVCQAAISSSETIMAHLRAANAAKAYLPTIAAEVSAALGADFGRLAAPETC